MGLINIREIIKETANRVFGSVYSGSESVDTTKSSLSSQTIPKGSTVLVRADPGNGDKIFIGGANESSADFKLEAGASTSLAVSDVSEIDAKAASGTQTLRWITEGE